MCLENSRSLAKSGLTFGHVEEMSKIFNRVVLDWLCNGIQVDLIENVRLVCDDHS